MNLVTELQSRITQQRRRVVILGDAMEDRWVHGYLVPSQDGCPKFVQQSSCSVPGGAANAQRSITHWKAEVSLFTLPDNLRPIKTRFVDDRGIILWRWDDETALAKSGPSDYRWVRDLALEMVGCAGAVLLSDYDKGFLPPEFIRRVTDLCQHRGIPCVADCKRPPDTYPNCILKCNAEYQHNHNDALSRLIYDVDQGQSLVVTDSMLNPGVWDRGELQRGFPFLPPVDCVNHVGAGDCFAAHLTLALAYGLSLKEAAVLAHSAGRVYVHHEHNRPPYLEEIMLDLASVLSPASPTASIP